MFSETANTNCPFHPDFSAVSPRQDKWICTRLLRYYIYVYRESGMDPGNSGGLNDHHFSKSTPRKDFPESEKGIRDRTFSLLLWIANRFGCLILASVHVRIYFQDKDGTVFVTAFCNEDILFSNSNSLFRKGNVSFSWALKFWTGERIPSQPSSSPNGGILSGRETWGYIQPFNSSYPPRP